jgi:hypothetical protein
MTSGIILIFAVPMIVAAALISPAALHNLTHGLLFNVIVGFGLPIVGWQTFLAVFAFPPSGTSRIAAVLNIWLGGTVMVAAVFNPLMAVLDYSPARPGPNPTAGFLLAGFTVCMFVSCGVWGAVASVLPRKVAVGGALRTGALLFLAVATLGFLVSR